MGVHQNLTFQVNPDPISGMHCWHQRVRVTRALGLNIVDLLAHDTVVVSEAALQKLDEVLAR